MRHKPNDSDLVRALIRYAAGETGACVRGAQVVRHQLKGGYVSKTVERIDLTMIDSTDAEVAASFVQKSCLESEIRSVAVVRAVPGADAVPDIVLAWSSAERPLDQQANGFVSPFYAGGPLTFDDQIPELVLVTLARIHAYWHDASLIDWTWVFDRGHFRRQHERAITSLASSANFRTSASNHTESLRRLEHLGRSDALLTCSDTLPKSLTHGDMHPGNIVCRPDGSPVIIDWGNACVASSMLDLANIIRIDSPEWRVYLSAYQEAQGPIDEATCRRGYWWARAATGLQYLPWIAEHTADADRMIQQIEHAEERLRDGAWP